MVIGITERRRKQKLDVIVLVRDRKAIRNRNIRVETAKTCMKASLQSILVRRKSECYGFEIGIECGFERFRDSALVSDVSCVQRKTIEAL